MRVRLLDPSVTCHCHAARLLVQASELRIGQTAVAAHGVVDAEGCPGRSVELAPACSGSTRLDADGDSRGRSSTTPGMNTYDVRPASGCNARAGRGTVGTTGRWQRVAAPVICAATVWPGRTDRARLSSATAAMPCCGLGVGGRIGRRAGTDTTSSPLARKRHSCTSPSATRLASSGAARSAERCDTRVSDGRGDQFQAARPSA